MPGPFAIPNDPTVAKTNAAIRDLIKIRSKLQAIKPPVEAPQSTEKLSNDIRELVAERVKLEKSYHLPVKDPLDKEYKNTIHKLKKFRPITKKITDTITFLEGERLKIAKKMRGPTTIEVAELNSKIRKLVKIRTDLELKVPVAIKKSPMKDLETIDHMIRNLELNT